jgi:hypothetical protein
MSTVISYRKALPPGLNKLMRMNRFAYQRLLKNWEVLLRTVTRNVVIETPCVLTFTVHASLDMDWENAAVCQKIPMDCLVRLGLIPDDSPKYIMAMNIRQEKCPRKDVGFTMLFTPLHEIAPEILQPAQERLIEAVSALMDATNKVTKFLYQDSDTEDKYLAKHNAERGLAEAEGLAAKAIRFSLETGESQAKRIGELETIRLSLTRRVEELEVERDALKENADA